MNNEYKRIWKQSALSTYKQKAYIKWPTASTFGVLHDLALAENTLSADHVCLSVRMIQLKNRSTDVNEIWYGRCATGDYPKVVLLSFLQSGNTNMANE
jgi:hypothetical protein